MAADVHLFSPDSQSVHSIDRVSPWHYVHIGEYSVGPHVVGTDRAILGMLMSGAKDHMNRKEAAAYLCSMGYRISYRTLEDMARHGQGPRYVRFGWRIVTYARADLDAWAKSQAVVIHGSQPETKNPGARPGQV